LAFFIYTDEAGWEPDSPRTIVASVIVHADKQILALENHLAELVRAIPSHLRGLGPISVKSLWGDTRYRDGWDFPDRKRTILNIMGVARKANIPIAFSVVPRKAILTDISPSDHALIDLHMAIAGVAAKADKAIRDYGAPTDVGMFIYEDMGNHHELINHAMNRYRVSPEHMGLAQLYETAEEKRLGYRTQEGDMRVERIRGRTLFLKKDDDPLLLLADAAAYGLRRYFNDEKFGDEMVDALLGTCPHKPDFAEASFTVFYQGTGR